MSAIPTNFVDNIGMFVNAAYLNNLGTEVNANIYARPLSGTRSAMPAAAATNKGAVYYCTDCDAIYQSNGSAWSKMRIAGKAGPSMSDPPSSGLTTSPLGSATLAGDRDARLLSMPTSDANWRVEHATLSPTSGYTATAYIEMNTTANSCLGGIVLLASNGTTLIGFGPGNNNSANTVFIFGTTALNTIAVTKAQLNPLVVPNWYRIRDDGTNNNFEYSLNGTDWQLAYSEARTAYLTPAKIGWGGINNSSTALKARCRSLVVTTP